jgi:hypothetical protein
VSWEQFVLFANQACAYYGTVRRGIGIDRVDNGAGYVYDNCVACYRSCNSGKNNSLYEEWADWLSRIAQRYGGVV